jgi:hypothetical protein
MEAIFFSETSNSLRSTWRYNPEDSTLLVTRRDNLKLNFENVDFKVETEHIGVLHAHTLKHTRLKRGKVVVKVEIMYLCLIIKHKA